MSRKEAMQIIVDLGGHCQDGVNKETNYLTKDILARNGKNIEDIRCNINSSN